MRVERIVPGRRPPRDAAGSVLARDVRVAGERLAKGRRLSDADVRVLVDGGPADGVTILVAEEGDLHEDAAASRLAAALAGGGIRLAGPAESRVDLVADADGVARVRAGALERIARIDPVDAFSVLDGQVVAAGDLVASVKVTPHVVAVGPVERAEAIARRGGPVVAVAPFRRLRVAALVLETVRASAGARFEAGVRDRVAGLGCELVALRHAVGGADAAEAALRGLVAGPDRADIVLAAGSAVSDPLDPALVALARIGGRVVRQGAPAHPGSMLWLARARRTTILGLPSCGAYSKATAVDLLLPWLVAGAPPTAATVARLAHGGVLSRDMRFRFPRYARALDDAGIRRAAAVAPEGAGTAPDERERER